jgi:hypothetical protein
MNNYAQGLMRIYFILKKLMVKSVRNNPKVSTLETLRLTTTQYFLYSKLTYVPNLEWKVKSSQKETCSSRFTLYLILSRSLV